MWITYLFVIQSDIQAIFIYQIAKGGRFVITRVDFILFFPLYCILTIFLLFKQFKNDEATLKAESLLLKGVIFILFSTISLKSVLNHKIK